MFHIGISIPLTSKKNQQKKTVHLFELAIFESKNKMCENSENKYYLP